jgi:hypothetical protein
MRPVLLLILAAGIAFPQGPPPPPPPPAFMGMQGLPLACFDKPAFEEDGLEFFVCNGGLGLGGVRKKADASKTIYVSDVDLALNLNMRVAKALCGKGRFGVRGTTPYSFQCEGEVMRFHETYQPTSKADWKKYLAYLRK